MKRKLSLLLFILSSTGLFAANATSNNISALKGGLEGNAAGCAVRAEQACGDPRSADYGSCVTKTLSSDNSVACQQVMAIYQKEGILPNHLHKVGKVTVFTLMHLGDGIESYHMVDSNGDVVELVDDQNPVIKSDIDWLTIKKQTPPAALMPMAAQEVKHQPTIKHGKDVTEIIFSQPISAGGCVACPTIGTAKIGYEFKSDGTYNGVRWISYQKTKS